MGNDKIFEIFKKHRKDTDLKIGIGMGRTMLEFSKILPAHPIYYSASNQTEIFLRTQNTASLQTISEIDIYFDSADFYDSFGNLIKGGGGALVHEKLMMKMSKKSIIIVQKHKFVKSFQNIKVPIEILKASYGYFLNILGKNGIKGKLRTVNDLSPFLTDNGNYIIDVEFNEPFIQSCKSITGVIEHGYFPNSLNFKIEEIE
jgi:ribose 5-phosphate isomerase